MRRIALVVAVLAGLAGAALAPPQGSYGACAFVVVWHDRAYVSIGEAGPIQASPGGSPLDGAQEPGCNDTGGANERPTPIAAKSIPGVPPAVAIAADGHPLVAWGYFIATGSDETRGCALGGPVRITGRAHVGLGLVDVSVEDTTVRLRHLLRGSAQILPDGHTTFERLSRNGFPYIAEGQRVQVDADFCKVPGSIGTKIVARRIVPAGPVLPPSTAEDILGADWRGRPDIFSRATGGHSWAVYTVIAVTLIASGVILGRHRSRPSGTG